MSESDKLAVEEFRRDVVDPSRTSLVIVDFWAEWCGPCKQLTPVIEKVCAEYATKGVKLVKINVDENAFIAAQFRVQSIPTVYAIFQGQPVADLTQARTEGQFKQRSEEHTSELQSLMRISYAVFCLKKKKNRPNNQRQKQKQAITHSR